MRYFFGGAEIGTHRALLEEMGVRHVAMSYMGLRRRVQFKRQWLISAKFPSYMSVFLDSGAYTVNNKPDTSPDEIEEFFEHYKDFVNANLDRVEMVSEYDAIHMGQEWIEEQRENFWDHLPREKFMAIWHPIWGVPYLNEMASKYEIIGIPETSLEGGRDLRPTLNAIAAKGVRLHGIGTKIDEMQRIHWASVASTSWTSPQRYGDTIIWTGKELKRYPVKYKDRARKQHRNTITDMGLDAAKIAADDPNEVLRLSILSWVQFENYVNQHSGKSGEVTPFFSHAQEPEVETPDDAVDTLSESPVEKVSTPSTSKALARPRAATEMLPIMALSRAKPEEEDSPHVLNIRSESPRVCDTCFLRDKCPGFEEGSTCLYNIPIEIRTREQVKSLRQAMMEIQTQRVMFMRMAEELEGGYADPNLSNEVKLLSKMVLEYEEAEREGFTITMTGRGSSQQAEGGMMSRIFGKDAGQKSMELPAPIAADEYIDAEIIHDTDEAR